MASKDKRILIGGYLYTKRDARLLREMRLLKSEKTMTASGVLRDLLAWSARNRQRRERRVKR